VKKSASKPAKALGRPPKRPTVPLKAEANVSLEFMLVTFPEERTVQANGANVGFTNHTLMLPADEYTVTLSGAGYAPPSQDIVLTGTTVMQPKVVIFTKA